MEEFNKNFNDLVSSLDIDIKPLDNAILIYYIEAFGGDMRYQIRDKEPITLKGAQEMETKIDKNMKALGKSNLPGFTRGGSYTQSEPKDKPIVLDGKYSSTDPIKDLIEMIRAMESNHATQLNAMQNILISMERSHSNRFHPRQNNKKS